MFTIGRRCAVINNCEASAKVKLKVKVKCDKTTCPIHNSFISCRNDSNYHNHKTVYSKSLRTVWLCPKSRSQYKVKCHKTACPFHSFAISG